MSRIRTIKPDFFLNEEVAELSLYARLTFIGLWTLADKEGRLEDRPKRIKAQLLPYDDVDMDALLNELHCASGNFILRYVAQGCAYIQVRNFTKHQRITGTEAQSESRIPAYLRINGEEESIEIQHHENAQNGNTLETPKKQQGSVEETPWMTGRERKGKEEEGKEKKCANAQDVIARFEQEFWATYPHKKDKERAKKSWLKINPDEVLTQTIVNAIQNQAKEKEIKLASNAFCPEWPMPSTWLNNRRWEDEITLNQINTNQGNSNGSRKYTVADDNAREEAVMRNLARQRLEREQAAFAPQAQQQQRAVLNF